ncbi:hypothetical protein BG005_003617, partial [Podila minutissima]
SLTDASLLFSERALLHLLWQPRTTSHKYLENAGITQKTAENWVTKDCGCLLPIMTIQFTDEQCQYLDSLGPTIQSLTTHLDLLENVATHLTDLENCFATAPLSEAAKDDLLSSGLNNTHALYEDRISVLEISNSNRVIDHLQHLEQEFKTYQDTHPSGSTSSITVAPASKSAYKLKEPPKFAGKRDECHSFFSNLALHFAKSHKDFDGDMDKVLYAISYLEGPPFHHMEPYLAKLKNNPDAEALPNILTDFEIFEKAMTNSFGIANAPVAAAAKIKNLRQTSTVAAYATEF